MRASESEFYNDFTFKYMEQFSGIPAPEIKWLGSTSRTMQGSQVSMDINDMEKFLLDRDDYNFWEKVHTRNEQVIKIIANLHKRFKLAIYSNGTEREVNATICQATVEKGLAGGEPDSTPTYQAMGNLYFDSVEMFQNSFGPNADKIMGDMPNYTNIEPIIQISEVMI